MKKSGSEILNDLRGIPMEEGDLPQSDLNLLVGRILFLERANKDQDAEVERLKEERFDSSSTTMVETVKQATTAGMEDAAKMNRAKAAWCDDRHTSEGGYAAHMLEAVADDLDAKAKEVRGE